jgi:hypothetical protein
MSALSAIQPLSVEGLDMKMDDGVVRMSGTITMRSPSQTLQPHLKKIHEAAVADGVTSLVVDVRKLSFVNSSSMRLFVDWTVWLKDVAAPQRYKLTFSTDPNVTWQRKSFPVIRSLAPDIVEIRSEQA